MDTKRPKQQPKIAAIIPAHNEESTVEHVVAPLVACRAIDEVIVISDGSTDGTSKKAREAGARVIELGTQSGKGGALLAGVSQTRADILAFFDADLRGLTSQHAEMLVQPVRDTHLAMNVGLRDRGRLINSLYRHLPLISGERALRRDVFANIRPAMLRGYRVEAALNYYCRSHKLPYSSIVLPGVSIRTKFEKVGVLRALWQYCAMATQVLRAMLEVRLARFTGRF